MFIPILIHLYFIITLSFYLYFAVYHCCHLILLTFLQVVVFHLHYYFYGLYLFFMIYFFDIPLIFQSLVKHFELHFHRFERCCINIVWLND